jgi:hypothetical protein
MVREGERSWNQNTKEKKQFASKDLGRSKLHSTKSGISVWNQGRKNINNAKYTFCVFEEADKCVEMAKLDWFLWPN